MKQSFDGNVLCLRRFELLENRCDVAAREYVSRKQEHRNAVHGTSSSPDTMLVAPGPIEEVHANARRRLLIFEKATAV